MDEAAEFGGGPQRFEEPLRGRDVAGVIAVEVGPAFDQARHCGEVENGLGVGDDGVERIGAEVEFEEAKSRPAAQSRRDSAPSRIADNTE